MAVKARSVHKVLTAYSFESNRKVERLNRTLLDMAWTMMFSVNVCQNELWAEAIGTACFIQNRLVTNGCCESSTVYEIIYMERPNVALIWRLGSKVFVYKP